MLKEGNPGYPGQIMKPELNNERPIYLQIAESIEDDILNRVLEEEAQAPSTNQLAAVYRINPATAAKGINLLVSEGILYKKRGLGMFVSSGAAGMIKKKRKSAFAERFIVPLLEEAVNLDVTREEVIAMIKKEKMK